MRVPHLHFRLRTLMIVVAIVAFLMGGSITSMRMNRLARDNRRKAIRFAHDERVFKAMADRQAAKVRHVKNYYEVLKSGGDEQAVQSTKEWLDIVEHGLAGYRASAAKYARLRKKYERAASYPWLFVEPDLPEPK